ncbi:hypothetical protein Nepgr_007394 [Nepenthes gracilis]|uniref:Peptide deformylase n=1 Tax=Nepenthes gracilis TaxID=150966 RepID=A0AAD3S730_NEPGR|nr:hypothetical protein Nepgr_007394 [Nepenthes gracilis]
MSYATWLYPTSISQAFLPLFSRSLTLRATFSSFRPLSHHARVFLPAKPPNSQFVGVLAMAKRSASFEREDFASPADMYFEPPLKIVEYPDPRLRAKNKPINTFDDNLKKLIDEMFNVMYKTDGIGISAPQVGINIHLMVFNPTGERGEGEELVFINPRVIKYSKNMTLFSEGCLSFPGIYADVERPLSIKIDARDITGSKFTVNLSGLPSRVFQHEFDHLQGVLFFERMTEEVLERISAELEALEKKYEDGTGLPSPEKIGARKRRKVAVGFGRS